MNKAIQILLSEGKIKDALELLLPTQPSVTLLLGDYNRGANAFSNNLVLYDEWNRAQSRISQSILMILDEEEKKQILIAKQQEAEAKAIEEAQKAESEKKLRMDAEKKFHFEIGEVRKESIAVVKERDELQVALENVHKARMRARKFAIAVGILFVISSYFAFIATRNKNKLSKEQNAMTTDHGRLIAQVTIKTDSINMLVLNKIELNDSIAKLHLSVYETALQYCKEDYSPRKSTSENMERANYLISSMSLTKLEGPDDIESEIDDLKKRLRKSALGMAALRNGNGN